MIIFQLIQKPQLRGAEVFASQLSQHLNQIDNECLLITIFQGDAILPFTGKIVNLNRPVNRRFFDLQGWKQFAELIKIEKPDIIQANAADTLKFAVLSKLIFKWKTPIIFRNASKIGDLINSKPKYWLNKFFMDKLAHVISVSHLCKENFIKTFHFPLNKIDTVQIGINLRSIGQIPDDLTSIYKKGPVLVNVAGLTKEKNHNGLLEIFSLVLKVHTNAQLFLVGEGPLKNQLQAVAEELKINNNVHFLGNRNDVLEIVKASKCFLLTSYLEGLPGVILEAQYCKTPVVAYNVGGISEVVQNEKTGFLIEKDQEENFANAVLQILNAQNANGVRCLTDKAYEQVINQFDNRIIAQRFLSVYKRLLE